jgi:heptosyltransferase-2
MKPNCKTLVIRFSSVGDIVLSTPLLRALRRRFPEGQIDYLTKKEYAELVRSNHNLNVTHEYDPTTGLPGLQRIKERIRAEQYDLIVDIHNSLRSKYVRSFSGATDIAVLKKRQFERFLLVKLKKNIYPGVISVSERYIEPVRKFGVEDDGKGLELHIPDEVLFAVSGKMARLKLNEFEEVIGICPSARHFTKQWPEERYAETGIRFAREHKAKVLVFGGPDDMQRCSAISGRIRASAGADSVTDFAGQLSLMETAAAMQFCDVVVTNDSGLMHIAAAMQKKIVAIFGSTVQEFGFFPISAESVVLERNGLYCRPCSHIGRSSCPEGHFRCMKEIEVGEVVQAVKQLRAKAV